MSFTREEVVAAFQQIQDSICAGIERADGKSVFTEDAWEHATGGGGKSRVIVHGNVFEKGGVNFSAVSGNLPPFLKEKVSALATAFFATGVSIVLHPNSPHVPIIHMNIRYFETDAGDAWFGGGIDLTPIYINKKQAADFHASLRNTCDAFHTEYYHKFKIWADDYFFIKHRNETRGVGGVFYDYLREDDAMNKDELFAFSCAIGNTFLKAYLPIVEANKKLSYSDDQKKWQLLRRGRYVEFNLVYDRGTRFGLETGGRIESILMSLPEYASWVYNYNPDPGTAEAETLQLLRKGVDWVA
jgi:coproporphyrinogen III oxidase